LDAQKKTGCNDWHPADIVAALRKRGWSLRSLSVARGFAAGSLSEAIRKPWPKAEVIIADAIGVAPEAIWPSRYDHRRPRRGVGGKPTHRAVPDGAATSSHHTSAGKPRKEG